MILDILILIRISTIKPITIATQLFVSILMKKSYYLLLHEAYLNRLINLAGYYSPNNKNKYKFLTTMIRIIMIAAMIFNNIGRSRIEINYETRFGIAILSSPHMSDISSVWYSEIDVEI